MNFDELARKTRAELVSFGAEQGIELTMAQAKPDMLAALCRAMDIDPNERPPELMPKGDPMEERVLVEIYTTEKAGGTKDVPIAVNGETVLVKRGYRVPLKRKFVEVLKNAVERNYEEVPDPMAPGRYTRIERDVLAYPFQVHGPA